MIALSCFLSSAYLKNCTEKKMEDRVTLLDFWASSYAMRVRIALAEKGIKYEAKEENLPNKSPLLLEMNPVLKKIPVLIHNGKPICESVIIVQYIDENWKNNSPLLPSDPYLRSQAKFWAVYIDNKIQSVSKRIWTGKGEDQDAAKRDFIESLKIMEEQLGDQLYFGGASFGFVDVVLVPITSWFYTVENFGNFSIEAECPKFMSWARRCMQEKESVSKSLPDPLKIYKIALEVRKKLGLE